MTNDEGMTNSESRMPEIHSSFGIRHSFVIGYFVIRHSSPAAVSKLIPALKAGAGRGGQPPAEEVKRREEEEDPRQRNVHVSDGQCTDRSPGPRFDCEQCQAWHEPQEGENQFEAGRVH